MLTGTESLLNQTIEGYRLERVLGRGGMSVVFLGQSESDPHDQVAIKVLKPTRSLMLDEYASFHTRFMREAQTLHQLRHEHIVPVLSYGEADDFAYMVMPFIAGGSLHARLAQQKRTLSLDEIASYVKQLASALDYAHQHGVVHRDIKPSNVLLADQGNLYLADFGIAHLYEPSPGTLHTASTTLTAIGEMIGTPAYIAPERFLGEQAGPPADIYALGIMLYLLVTGRVPFQAENPLALGLKHLYEAPSSPRVLRPDLPELAEAALLRAIAKQPAQRFASAEELARDFASGLAGRLAAEEIPPVPPPLVLLPESSQAQAIPAEETGQPVVQLAEGALPARLIPVERTRSGQGWRMLLASILATAIVLLALLIGIMSGGQRFALLSSPLSLPTSAGQQATSIKTSGAAQPRTVPFANKTVTISVNNNTVSAVNNSNGVLLWRYAVNGQIVPPPVAVVKVIYVETATGSVYALQGDNGHILWSYNTGNPVSAPLVVTNGVVYVHTTNGFVYELRASDGKLLAIIALTRGITPTPRSGITPTEGMTPTPTPAITPTAGMTPTPTSAITPTAGVTPTPTLGVTPTPTPGMTPTPTPGVTPTATPKPKKTLGGD